MRKDKKGRGESTKKGGGWPGLREESGGIDTAEKSFSCLTSSSLIQTCVGGSVKKQLGDMQHGVQDREGAACIGEKIRRRYRKLNSTRE